MALTRRLSSPWSPARCENVSDEVNREFLIQFKAAIDDGSAEGTKANIFDSTRRKLPEGTPRRLEMDELWTLHEQRKAQGSRRAAPIARAATERRDSHGRRPGNASRAAGNRRPGGTSPTGPAQGTTPQRGDNEGGAEASCLGEPFHNPYTFVPFPDPAKKARRGPPTPLSIDEVESDRVSGVLDLQIRTLSPLLTCDPIPVSETAGHKAYKALQIGTDVIVPASGVRGSLRTLMTILTGGTLGYLDDGVWLTQGRDLPLGPRSPKRTHETWLPRLPFLARVLKVGSKTRPGLVLVGLTKLVDLRALESLIPRLDDHRPTRKDNTAGLWVDKDLTSHDRKRSLKTPWQVKLSGRPITRNDRKREGVFLDTPGIKLELPAGLWAAYAGRHAHRMGEELREDDLVWLEPIDPEVERITSPGDVKSIQWARWGREGEQLLDVVRTKHAHVLPDSFNPDGLVDEVTDLFGQIPLREPDAEGRTPAGPFAARIRPENLVFHDAGQNGLERKVTLAPLAPPHPGCAAFYRDQADLDLLSNHKQPLRGYKVYRTTSERGASAPWRFETQGVYAKNGLIESSIERDVNKTCDLLREGQVGRLRISFRALSVRELALLLAACTVDWRLGGGKPLGLGHCRVTSLVALDERGQELARVERSADGSLALPARFAAEIDAHLKERMALWQASQLPVQRLRYPRAVEENNNRKQRGGHVWFQRHAQPHKNQKSGAERAMGLEVLWVEGKLRAQIGDKHSIRAQALPRLSAVDPAADVLFGFDLIAPQSAVRKVAGKNYHSRIEPFDPGRHSTG